MRYWHQRVDDPERGFRYTGRFDGMTVQQAINSITREDAESRRRGRIRWDEHWAGSTPKIKLAPHVRIVRQCGEIARQRAQRRESRQ